MLLSQKCNTAELVLEDDDHSSSMLSWSNDSFSNGSIGVEADGLLGKNVRCFDCNRKSPFTISIPLSIVKCNAVFFSASYYNQVCDTELINTKETCCVWLFLYIDGTVGNQLGKHEVYFPLLLTPSLFHWLCPPTTNDWIVIKWIGQD